MCIAVNTLSAFRSLVVFPLFVDSTDKLELTVSARRLGLLELQECDASMSCSGSGVPGKEEAVQITFSWREAKKTDTLTS